MLSYRCSVEVSRSRVLQSVSSSTRNWARTWTHIQCGLKIGFPPSCSLKNIVVRARWDHSFGNILKEGVSIILALRLQRELGAIQGKYASIFCDISRGDVRIEGMSVVILVLLFVLCAVLSRTKERKILMRSVKGMVKGMFSRP